MLQRQSLKLVLDDVSFHAIPFNTATPNNAINPTPALILKGIPRIAKNNIPPIAESGIAE